MTVLLQPKSERVFSSDERVKHGRVLLINCLSGEPSNREFKCIKGKFVAQGDWTSENNGTFPQCREGMIIFSSKARVLA